MIRVAVFVPRYYPIFGGAENQAKLLNKTLLASKEVSIPFIITHWLNPELKKVESIEEISVHRLGRPVLSVASRIWLFICAFFFLCQHRKKFDLIHSHASSIAGFFITLAGFLLRKPVILKLTTTGEMSYQPSSKIRRIVRSLMMSFMRKRAHMICLNREGYRELQDMKFSYRHLIPNGIAFDKKRNSVMTREAIGLTAQDFVIVFSGRFDQRKGIDVLVKAFLKFEKQEQVASIKLLLLGSAKNQEGVFDLTAAMNQTSNIITFEAPPDQVLDYLSLADLFVFPSLREGMPNTVIEAISVGLSCVLSDIDPHREIIDACICKDGLSIFKVGNEEALLECLLREYKTGRRKIEMQRLPDQFNILMVAQQYVQLYHHLLCGK